MSDTTGSPFTTERELAEDQQHEAGARAGSPADTPPPSNPPVDQEALDKGVDQLERVKPY
ncbi:MAG TPA: hypothetical protein VGI54_03680 [Solirubrobacteraceae bacterium]|jgi:hypothetical protein